MRSRIPILAVLSVLTLIVTACGAQATPAFVVSSTPVAGYGGTPLPATAAIPATGGTAMPPAATQASSSGSSGGVYGGGGTSATQSMPSTGGTGTAQIMAASNARLGSIVVDASGKTLYVRTTDTPNTSTCYAQCAQIWPPLVASGGSVNAGSGLDSSKIGTALRTDGTTQVTYNGWPLYHFSGDAAPGDTNGQGYYNIWYVLSPDGNPLK